MGVSSAQLAACKQYMRVDYLTDDDLITTLMEAALDYLNLTGTAPLTQKQTLAVHVLTLHWYDHRDDVSSVAAFPAGVRPIINQIKAEQAIASVTDPPAEEEAAPAADPPAEQEPAPTTDPPAEGGDP